MTYASRVGDFTTINQLPAGSALQPTPGATAYAMSAPMSPQTRIPLGVQDLPNQENQRMVEQLVDVLGSRSADEGPRPPSDMTCR
jgi:hypothetical protein